MATFKTKAKAVLRALTKPHRLFQEKQFVFIVSHMRARTTLLSHILNTSSEIVGSNELHVRYRHSIDEIKARTMRIHDSGFTEATYICDKLLHNRLEINTDRYQNAKYIFNLRPVEDTFKSLLLRHLQNESESDAHKLSNYYNDRLLYMKNLWLKIPAENRIYINSDDVIDQTSATLSKLQKFLSLQNELTDEYNVNEHTGESGHGDMSANIRQGKVVKTAPTALSHEQHKLLKEICTGSEKKLFAEVESIFNRNN